MNVSLKKTIEDVEAIISAYECGMRYIYSNDEIVGTLNAVLEELHRLKDLED
jgi:hypothetical protein